MASSSSSSGVPPGFRFHPTDEELLLYYLKKKISFEKFDLEVIREVDLNKVEPWDLQERCRIGSTPQNEWYFFSHKDRKYPTGSRTNRATIAGFWKATGRDKCIRTTYRKIGMRKTLVFYRGRAPHGQKTDWIMHEYRLEDSDDDPQADDTDGWVICRVFKKKCFFKAGTGEGSSSQGAENPMTAAAVAETHDHHSQALLASSYYNIHQHQHQHLLLHHHHQASNMYGKAEHGLHYPQMPPHDYSHVQVQVQDLLPNHRAAGYGYEAGLEVVDGGGDHGQSDHWAMLDAVEGRFGGAGAAAAAQQMGQIPQQQRGGEMDLWGYGK